MNHKFSGAFIWEKMFKKKKKKEKNVSSVKSLVLNKATCSFSLSVPLSHCPFHWPSWLMNFCFCRPFLHTRAYMGSNKTPLELSQNEIKFQGIMCFERRVLFLMVFGSVVLLLSVGPWTWDAVCCFLCFQVVKSASVCVRRSQRFEPLLKHQRYF